MLEWEFGSRRRESGGGAERESDYRLMGTVVVFTHEYHPAPAELRVEACSKINVRTATPDRLGQMTSNLEIDEDIPDLP